MYESVLLGENAMRRRTSTGAIFLLQLICGGCAATPNVSACTFAYDEKFQSTVIIPALQKEFGELYKYFNYDKPLIERKGETLEYAFGSFKTVDGKNLAYEGLLFVTVDACTGRVLRQEVKEGVGD